MIQAANFNEQFIARNIYEFGNMLIAFRELNQHYNCNLILSLDGDEWIIFDLRVGRDIYKCKFKHWKDFQTFCCQLLRDISKCGFAHIGLRYGRNIQQSETWSINRLSKIYTEEEMLYFKHH